MDLKLLYSGYATKQLLLMLTEARSGTYSPQEIAIIKDILGNRRLTEAELALLNGGAANPAPQQLQPTAPAFNAATLNYGQRPTPFARPDEEIADPYNNSETVTLLRWLIVLITGIPTLYQLYSMINAYQQASTMYNTDWDKMIIILLGYFITIGIAVTGLVFFIRQRPLGWYILAGLSTYQTVSVLLSSLITISLGYTEVTNILFVMLLFTAGELVLLLLPALTRRFRVKRLPAVIVVVSLAVVATVFTLAQFASLLFHRSHLL